MLQIGKYKWNWMTIFTNFFEKPVFCWGKSWKIIRLEYFHCFMFHFEILCFINNFSRVFLCLKCGVSAAQRVTAQHNGIPLHTKQDSSTNEVSFIYVVRQGNQIHLTSTHWQTNNSNNSLQRNSWHLMIPCSFVTCLLHVLLCKYNNPSLQA